MAEVSDIPIGAIPFSYRGNQLRMSPMRASVAQVRTADHIQHVLIDYQHGLEEAEGTLNALNVFPIADADTGTNLKHTIAGIVRSLFSDHDLALVDVGQRIAAAALQESRGNSGLIMGQYLTGLVRNLVEDPWPEEWSTALNAAAKQCRAAVSNPVEGTILTVADRAAEATGDNSPALLRCAAGLASEAVTQTEFQLDVLRDRGVVDAGGFALALFLETLSDVVGNEPEFTIEQRLGDTTTVAAGGIPPTEAREVVGYELQFNCRERSGLLEDDVRSQALTLGSDVVVASHDGVIAVHLHTPEVGQAVEAFLHAKPFGIRIEALLVSQPKAFNT